MNIIGLWLVCFVFNSRIILHYLWHLFFVFPINLVYSPLMSKFIPSVPSGVTSFLSNIHSLIRWPSYLFLLTMHCLSYLSEGKLDSKLNYTLQTFLTYSQPSSHSTYRVRPSVTYTSGFYTLSRVCVSVHMWTVVLRYKTEEKVKTFETIIWPRNKTIKSLRSIETIFGPFILVNYFVSQGYLSPWTLK